MVTMHDKAQGRIFLAGRRPGELAERLSQRLGISLSVWGWRPACETLRTAYSHSVSVISALGLPPGCGEGCTKPWRDVRR